MREVRLKEEGHWMDGAKLWTPDCELDGQFTIEAVLDAAVSRIN